MLILNQPNKLILFLDIDLLEGGPSLDSKNADLIGLSESTKALSNRAQTSPIHHSLPVLRAARSGI